MFVHAPPLAHRRNRARPRNWYFYVAFLHMPRLNKPVTRSSTQCICLKYIYPQLYSTRRIEESFYLSVLIVQFNSYYQITGNLPSKFPWEYSLTQPEIDGSTERNTDKCAFTTQLYNQKQKLLTSDGPYLFLYAFNEGSSGHLQITLHSKERT